MSKKQSNTNQPLLSPQLVVVVLLVFIVFIVFIAIAGYIGYIAGARTQNQQTPPPIPAIGACTTEAMLCPDGSMVGRSGPNCEFDQCPTASSGTGLCMVGGCNGELCGDDLELMDIATTCEYREEYSCYQEAICKRQSDGLCGWTDTPDLRRCLLNAADSKN